MPDDEELPTVEEFDQAKERLIALGCTCENVLTGWEDGGDTWYWYSQHETECDLWATPLNNDPRNN